MGIAGWRYRRFHQSHLIAWLCVGLLGGLILSKLGFQISSALVLVSAGFVAVSSFKRRRWWSVMLLIVCGFLVGIYRGTDMNDAREIYKNYARAEVLVNGVVKDDPVYGKRGDQQFRVSGVTINDQRAPGDVFVGTYNILDIKRGDTVVLRGKLQDGFGSYQASLRYSTLVQAKQSEDPVRTFRDTFATGVRNSMAEPAASLGLGFVVGQRTALPETLDDQLRIVGLTHIVVASGYNLTILVRFTRRLLAKHSKYLAAVTSGGLMVGFVAISGLSPSMTRAALVTGLSLLAWYYGRRFHPLLLIVYVAALTAMYNPIYLWSDIGWYLSFLAFAGVLIVAPLMTSWLCKDKDASPVLQLVIETVAAQIMTLPLILFIFGQLPILSLFSNVLVAPAIPLAMALTAAAGFLDMLFGGHFGIVGIAGNYVVGYVVAVVEWLASISWAQLQISISSWLMTALYVLIVVSSWEAWRRTKYNFRATSVVD